METPEGLTAREIKDWDAIVEKLSVRSDFDELWAPAIERYVRWREMSRNAWSKVPKTLLAKGSMDQKIAHPVIAIAQKADSEVAKHGALLGIEPVAAKGQGGKPQGSASKADRTAPAPVTPLRRVK